MSDQEIQPQEHMNRFLSLVEIIIYLFIAMLLIVTALFLVGSTAYSFLITMFHGDVLKNVIHVLDRLLLALMILEILHTIRVSIKEHQLLCEPFLIVGLIASVPRILVLSVEAAYLSEMTNEIFHHAMVETAILSVLILILVISIVLIRKYSVDMIEKKQNPTVDIA